MSIRAPFVSGIFTTPHAFLKATTAARERGLKGLDGWMPYPAHGFEKAFGFRRSFIGRPVLAMLILGAVAGYLMQKYMMADDWPMIFGGKPYNSWPAFVVITFESGILAGALVNMVLVLGPATQLKPHPHTISPRPECTEDAFALCIPLADNGDADEMSAVLRDLGAADIILHEPAPAPAPAPVAGQEEVSHA